MTPVGVELDAAVLRAMGYEVQELTFGEGEVQQYVIRKDGKTKLPSSIAISTEPNGHEALRLCGPWLDERCRWWAITTGETHIFGMGATKACDSVGNKADNATTRAEAICRLVLAVNEREGT